MAHNHLFPNCFAHFPATTIQTTTMISSSQKGSSSRSRSLTTRSVSSLRKNRRRILRAKVATDFASAAVAFARKKNTNGVVAVGGNSFIATTTTKTIQTTKSSRRFTTLLSCSATKNDSDEGGDDDENERQKEYYEGLYGTWTVTQTDELEVWSYRVALSLACLGAVGVVLGDVSGNEQMVNPSYFLGASGFGVALVLVHMYVTPIKRVMQALYAVGLIGSLGIVAYTQNGGSSSSLLEFVREHRSAVWVIGPMFASFTGLAFKEGACYGKPEAFLLFLLTPIMCLGHLTGLASDEVETFFVASWMLGFLVFAGRKYTQAVKDDIGDKSVFTFRGLKTDEERRDYLERQEKDLSLMEDAM